MKWLVVVACLLIAGVTAIDRPYEIPHLHKLVNYTEACGSYYSKIDPTLKGDAMIAQLHELIYPHTQLSYDALWTAFRTTDVGHPKCSAPNLIYPLYTGPCFDPNKQCGSYKKEGDCFNREHSWPKSWWGGFDQGHGSQTDLHCLMPSDGYVNGLRSDIPFDKVTAPTYTSSGGDKIGPCTSAGAPARCFEPEDRSKGDLARTYFYLSVAYRNVWTCCDVPAVNKWEIKDWEKNVLYQWHLADPVDSFEATRNTKICEQFQGNRNPFVDHPEWINSILSK